MEKVRKERLDVARAGRHAERRVREARAHERVAEIPGMALKGLVVHFVAQGAKILDSKDSRRARVPLTKGVYLPNPGNKPCDVMSYVDTGSARIGVVPLLRIVVAQRFRYSATRSVIHRLAFKNPFLFGDVVVAISRVSFQASRWSLRKPCQPFCHEPIPSTIEGKSNSLAPNAASAGGRPLPFKTRLAW